MHGSDYIFGAKITYIRQAWWVIKEDMDDAWKIGLFGTNSAVITRTISQRADNCQPPLANLIPCDLLLRTGMV